MKKLLQTAVLSLLLMSITIVSCRKENIDCPGLASTPVTEKLQPRYSTLQDFTAGIIQVGNLAGQYNVIAYQDTLPNGLPNIQGRKTPLIYVVSVIIEKLRGSQQQVESGVNDVFHFDGSTFSLISFILKAEMAGDISPQVAMKLLSLIPLPPIPQGNFQPPVEMVPLNLGTGDCCKDNICNPKLKILVTWVHVKPCGNYAKGKSGYAANDKLTGMSSGQSYRFTAEVTGCPCPGTLTHTVTTPAGASYGEGTTKDGSVDLLPVTPGTYTITFTYTVCGNVITKTFTLGVG